MKALYIFTQIDPLFNESAFYAIYCNENTFLLPQTRKAVSDSSNNQSLPSSLPAHAGVERREHGVEQVRVRRRGGH